MQLIALPHGMPLGAQQQMSSRFYVNLQKIWLCGFPCPSLSSSDAAPGASIPQGLVGADAASRGGRTIAVEGGELSRIHPIHPLLPDSVQLSVPAWGISLGSGAGRVSGICPASSSDAVGCQGTVPSAELVL